MDMDVKLADIVRLKKKHPCGSYEWQVVRLGADIGIKCLKCQHRVLLQRSVFERRVKAFVRRGQTNTDQTKEIEEQIADLKSRWPAHSAPPSMWQQLEALENELEKAIREAQARTDTR